MSVSLRGSILVGAFVVVIIIYTGTSLCQSRSRGQIRNGIGVRYIPPARPTPRNEPSSPSKTTQKMLCLLLVVHGTESPRLAIPPNRNGSREHTRNLQNVSRNIMNGSIEVKHINIRSRGEKVDYTSNIHQNVVVSEIIEKKYGRGLSGRSRRPPADLYKHCIRLSTRKE